MRSFASRLARLERTDWQCSGMGSSIIQYGYLNLLPPESVGPRHIATVRQLPSQSPGTDWFEWEERPGPEPAASAIPGNDTIIRVCYVEVPPKDAAA